MVVQRLSRSLLRQTSQFAAKASKSSSRCLTSSPWSQFEMAPVDPIVGLNEIYQKDDFPQKVIVGVGAYRDDEGKPYVLPCVREAEQILMDKKLDMEYTGIVSAVLCCLNWACSTICWESGSMHSQTLSLVMGTLVGVGWRTKVCRLGAQICLRRRLGSFVGKSSTGRPSAFWYWWTSCVW